MNSLLCLTDEQIDDHLIGEALAPEAAAHLAGCQACQARLEAAEAPLASFRAVSLAWAERRSATLPQVAVASSTAAGRRLAWAAVAVGVLALGISLPVLHEHSSHGPETAAQSAKQMPSQPAASIAAIGHTGIVSATPVEASPAQIARDNQMLQAIDRELDAPVVTPAAYGLDGGSARAHAQTHAADVAD